MPLKMLRVPFGFWLQDVLALDRNPYDRIGHFMQGLVPAMVAREVLLRLRVVRGRGWLFFVVACICLAISALYELIEWGAAVVFGGDLGQAYLGTEGDEWDAHMDMALASLGALVAMAITLCINLALQRDFASEWAESFRIKQSEPLGEEAVARMLAEG